MSCLTDILGRHSPRKVLDTLYCFSYSPGICLILSYFLSLFRVQMALWDLMALQAPKEKE